MKRTFRLKLDTEFTINFQSWELSDAQQRGGHEAKRLIIDHFLEQYGLEQFELLEQNSNTLSEAIATVVKAQKKYVLAHKKDFNKINNNNIETMSRSVTDKKPATQTIHLKPLIVHASECCRLMTNPLRKKDELAETTKTWLKEKAVEEVLGLRKKITTKPMIKGTVCEDKSIDLYNKVMLTDYEKNSVTKQQNGFCGTPDLIGKEGIIEIKTSWDASTFPFFRNDVAKRIKKSGYEWQCRVYMMLFGIERAFVSYCLVDTPRTTANGEILLNRWDDWTLHRFDGKVDPQKRISISEAIERDLSIEEKMRERYEIANKYYQNYLEEIYKK